MITINNLGRSVMLSFCPQRRCFAACSGFLIDCVPSGHGAEWADIIISKYLVIIIWDANIVQRVKTCYKIKINSRESKSCYCLQRNHRRIKNFDF